MNAEEMINRYINEVGEHLPSQSRADIAMELRSLIQDALDERRTGGDENDSAKLAAAVLTEFGAPATIAARYRREEVLIGAALFPTYRSVLTITLSIVIGVHMLGIILNLAENQSFALGETVAAVFDSFWQALFVNAAIVTLIFAIIERVAGNSLQANPAKLSEKQSSWDPYQLPPVKDPDRIQHGDLIAGVVVSLFLIGGLNFFFDAFGYFDMDDKSRRIIAIFAPEFRQHIPWLTAAWGLDILLKMLVLVQGRWNQVTRWLEITADGFGLYVLARIVMSDSITVLPAATTITKLVLGVIMLLVVIDIIRKLYKLLLGRSSVANSNLATQIVQR